VQFFCSSMLAPCVHTHTHTHTHTRVHSVYPCVHTVLFLHVFKIWILELCCLLTERSFKCLRINLLWIIICNSSEGWWNILFTQFIHVFRLQIVYIKVMLCLKLLFLVCCLVTFDDDEPNPGFARLTLTVKEMTVKKPLFGSARPENAQITSSFDNRWVLHFLHHVYILYVILTCLFDHLYLFVLVFY